MISVFMTEPCPRRERSFVCLPRIISDVIGDRREKNEKDVEERGGGEERGFPEAEAWKKTRCSMQKIKDKDHYEHAWMDGESYTCMTTTFPDLVSIATATPFLLRDSPKRKGRGEEH